MLNVNSTAELHKVIIFIRVTANYFTLTGGALLIFCSIGLNNCWHGWGLNTQLHILITSQAPLTILDMTLLLFGKS